MAKFRSMRRFKQGMIREECAEILKNEKRGVLSVIGDGGYPYGVPLNYYYDEERDSIYFHSAIEGHKIDAMNACDKVCFTVFEKEGVIDEEDDWSYHLGSVIAFGRASEITDDEEKTRAARLFGAKYFPTKEELDYEMGNAYSRVRMTAIKIEHMSGKRVHEK